MSSGDQRVLVAQLGARRHYAVARGLDHFGALNLLVTDACASSFPFKQARILGAAARRIPGINSILMRDPVGISADKVKGLFGFFLLNMWCERELQRAQRGATVWASRNRRFGEAVNKISWGNANVVYGYNGAAIEIFELAKKRGIYCVLDQTAAPWRYNTELLLSEQAKWPGWEESPADCDPNFCMAEREEAEWRLADRIICGSRFVVDAIRKQGGPVEKTRVVKYPSSHTSYSIAQDDSNIDETKSDDHSEESELPLRLLFAGTLQLRKGIQYVYELAETLKDRSAEWRAVGPSNISEASLKQLQERVDVIGQVPRSKMHEMYLWADAIIFPTLSEGSANVCLEALSLGKTVISTPACGVETDEFPNLRLMSIDAMGDYLRNFSTTSVIQVPHLQRTVVDYGRDLIQAMA